MTAKKNKRYKALILTAAISALTGLIYLLNNSPYWKTDKPTPAPREIIGEPAITGRVVGVSDGDTITVLDAGNRQHKIRLDGIDAPESRQAFGTRSKQSLSELVFGQTVTVAGSKTDRYGRTVGNVAVNGQDAGLIQVERGMAWFYRQYAGDLSRDRALDYERAEDRARVDRRGLWADAKPVEPWEYRAEARTAKRGTAKVSTKKDKD
ncbi:MAG: thermonuclease family protein [Acidobacteria bacterium]|nr:thermonuclease family protein [Acidobacteriota bacterium]